MENSIQIKINKSQGGKSIVSARELYTQLQVKTPFTMWFDRMKEYGFVENQDFVLVSQKCETNNPKNPTTTITDYAITLNMAKELCMIQRTDIGKRCRNYFIECEEQLKQYGGYAIPQTMSQALALASRQAEQIERQQAMLAESREKMARQEQTISEQQPKVLFADAVATSHKSILIAELAKILRQNGIQTGQKRLFEWLRNKGFLCAFGRNRNQPTQRAMEMGLFEIKKTTIQKPTGETLVSTTPMVTGHGQIYFINKFLSQVA